MLHAVNLPAEDGGRIIYAIFNDISGIKEMEEQLAHDKQELESVIRSIPGGAATFEVTPDSYRLVYCSDGVPAIFELTREAYSAAVHDARHGGHGGHGGWGGGTSSFTFSSLNCSSICNFMISLMVSSTLLLIRSTSLQSVCLCILSFNVHLIFSVSASISLDKLISSCAIEVSSRFTASFKSMSMHGCTSGILGKDIL